MKKTIYTLLLIVVTIFIIYQTRKLVTIPNEDFDAMVIGFLVFIASKNFIDKIYK